MKIDVVGHRVLVKPEVVTDTIDTDGGAKLYMPQQVVEMEQGGMDRGEVVGLGLEAYEGYKTHWCEVGDLVMWPRYAGKPIYDRETETMYHAVHDEDILCVYEND